jgi:uncharacterized membrane protein YqjE
MSAIHEREFKGREARQSEDDSNAGRSPDRSIRKILQEIVSSITDIIESEIRLASAEIKRDLTERSKAAISLIIAGVLILYAVGLVLLGIVYALSTVWPAWLAALVPAAVLAILAGIPFFMGRERAKRRPKLDMTAQTVEDNLRWLKNQMK